jgi:hypothetical protein
MLDNKFKSGVPPKLRPTGAEYELNDDQLRNEAAHSGLRYLLLNPNQSRITSRWKPLPISLPWRFIVLLNYLLLIRPYSDYVKDVRDGDGEDGPTGKRPRNGRLDLWCVFFFIYRPSKLLTHFSVLLRPYSDYVLYV